MCCLTLGHELWSKFRETLFTLVLMTQLTEHIGIDQWFLEKAMVVSLSGMQAIASYMHHVLLGGSILSLLSRILQLSKYISASV